MTSTVLTACALCESKADRFSKGRWVCNVHAAIDSLEALVRASEEKMKTTDDGLQMLMLEGKVHGLKHAIVILRGFTRL